MAAFVRIFAQKVTAEICPVQPFVMQLILIVQQPLASFPYFLQT
jgi:hypothetical protein